MWGGPRPLSLERTASLCARACCQLLQHLHVGPPGRSELLRNPIAFEAEIAGRARMKTRQGLPVSPAPCFWVLSRDPRPMRGPPLLVVRAGLGTAVHLAPRPGAADRRRIQRQNPAIRVLRYTVPQRDPPAPWPTPFAPPENTAQIARESARLRVRDGRRPRRARVLAPRGRRRPRGACRRSANQQPGPLTRGSRPISGRDLWCVIGMARRDWLDPCGT